jgi:polysaccharide biosynthesis/export protein
MSIKKLVFCVSMAVWTMSFASAQSPPNSTSPSGPRPGAQSGARAGTSAASPVTPQSPLSTAPDTPAPVDTSPGSPAANNAPNKAVGGAPSAPSPDLRIGVGDLLEITVFGAPDFDRQVRVSSSGEVTLPLIGPVHLAGLTAAEGEKLVEKRLLDGGYFNDPHVSIFAKEYQTQGVSVMGEVMKPGIYPMLGSHKLFDVISAAGGMTQKAGNQVTVTHREGDKPVENVTLAGNGSDSVKNNPDVLPGDTVVVQKAGIVYVVGDVHLPGGFIMDKPQLTVLQALAMAQGANPTAKLDGARLIRNSGGQRTEVPIALKKILASKAPDVNLQADDILFVPNSAAKSAFRRGMEAVVQAAVGVAIYHP